MFPFLRIIIFLMPSSIHYDLCPKHSSAIYLPEFRLVIPALRVDIVRFQVLPIDCTAHSRLRVAVAVGVEGGSAEVSGDRGIRQPPARGLDFIQPLRQLLLLLRTLRPFLRLFLLCQPRFQLFRHLLLLHLLLFPPLHLLCQLGIAFPSSLIRTLILCRSPRNDILDLVLDLGLDEVHGRHQLSLSLLVARFARGCHLFDDMFPPFALLATEQRLVRGLFDL